MIKLKFARAVKLQILLAGLFVQGIIAQTNSQLAGSYDKVTIPSPTASSFILHGASDLNHYTGTLPVNIEIAKLKENDIDLSVSLSGSARGIKAGEIPGWVGQGWSLNAGGVISRNTIGTPDDLQIGGLQIGFLHRRTDAKNFRDAINLSNPSSPNSSVLSPILNDNLCGENLDLQPDQFNFSFMGYSGSFFFDYDGTIRQNTFSNLKIEHEISYSNFDLGLYNYIDAFKITAPNGFVFHFRAKEYSTQTFTLYSQVTHDDVPFVSSWFLTKITSPNGGEINFTYTPYNYQTYRLNFNYFDKYWRQICLYNPNCYNNPGGQLNNTATFYKVYPIYLTNISAQNFVIDFLLENRIDYKSGHPDGLPAWNTINVHTEKKLTTINIRKIGGELIKSVSFTYTEANNSRLMLSSMKENDKPPYQFTYNSTIPVNFATRSVDHWGYYNGASNTTLIPPTTVDLSPGIGGTITIGNANRAANFSATLLGSLSRVTYPTGGYTEFEYELNDYKAINSLDLADLNRVTGGLRVKKVTDVDGLTTPAKVKEYKYAFDYITAPASTSTGAISYEPKYSYRIDYTGFSPLDGSVGIVTFQGNSVFPISYTHGSHVGYRRVYEIQAGNGSKEYNFTSFYTNQDENPVYSYPLNMVNITGTEVLRLAPLTGNDHKRGMPREVINRNEAGQMLSKTNYDYTTQSNNSFHDYFFTISKTPLPSGTSSTGACGAYMGITVGYKLKSEWFTRIKETNTLYNPATGSASTTETETFYDNPIHGNPTRQQTINSKGEVVTNYTRYPGDESSLISPSLAGWELADINEYKNKHIYNRILETETKKGTTPINRSRIRYGTYPFVAKRIDQETAGTGLSPELLFNLNNHRGSILEQQKPNGLKECYIWGYNYTYPIAKVTGANYTDILTALGQSDPNLPFLQNMSNTDLRNTLNTLRVNLKSIKPLALVHTYLYDPLIGIKEETNAGNKTSYYLYDAFNRLSLVKDQDGNILKRICYNYQGQPEVCYTPPSSGGGGVINPPPPIYARISYENVWWSWITGYADIVVRFYSDPAGTIPVSVTNLNVGHEVTVSGPPNFLGYVLCNGTSAVLQYGALIEDGYYNEWAGYYTWSYTYTLTPGDYIIIP